MQVNSRTVVIYAKKTECAAVEHIPKEKNISKEILLPPIGALVCLMC